MTTLTEKIDSLEKRELLRVRGNQFCRVCNRYQMTETWNPPISEWEQKYHDSNHAVSIIADPSGGLPAFTGTTSWDGVESRVAILRKPR